MDKILERHTRGEIAAICEVSYRTVLNWIKYRTIPLWAVESLGYTVAPIKRGGR